jgi:uncharacterized protein
MRVAVVGTGIAGNAAAYALSRAPHVSRLAVYEADTRAGGHSATVDIDYDGTPISVDTGFIVYNTLNYPHLTALFDHLGVPTKDSDMSFSLSLDRGGFEWTGRVKDVFSGLFAQKRNLANPRYLGMLWEILRFQKAASADLGAGRLTGVSLGDYIARGRYSAYFRDRYIVPMGAAIWSTPVARMLDFPAENFVIFFENHKLLHWDRPVWRTVAGGSREYVRRMTATFADNIRLAAGVTDVRRAGDEVLVRDISGTTEAYDQVVLAGHSDQSLAILADADEAEREVLSGVSYLPNDVWLHRDERLMPVRRDAWAAWNVLGESSGPAGELCVSYSMNLLQGIDPAKPLFVTLNPPQPPAAEKCFARFSYAHPQYDARAFAAQKRLMGINGRNRVWLAGAWTGYGFHEDGLRSGIEVAEALGAFMPWRSPVPQAAE